MNVVDRLLCGALYVVAVTLVVGGYIGAVASSIAGYSQLTCVALFVSSSMMGVVVFCLARACTQYHQQHPDPKEHP